MNNLGGFNWGDCTPQASTAHIYQSYIKASLFLFLANSKISDQLKDSDKD